MLPAFEAYELAVADVILPGGGAAAVGELALHEPGPHDVTPPVVPVSHGHADGQPHHGHGHGANHKRRHNPLIQVSCDCLCAGRAFQWRAAEQRVPSVRSSSI